MSLTVGSLCSGYEATSLGLTHAGWDHRLVFVADPDPAAGRVLAHQHPDVPNLGDITRIAWAELGLAGEIDLLCAGFPCTDISCAGKRGGLGEGTRSGIWSHVAKSIDVLRPRLALLENVAALLSTPANRSTDGPDSDVEPGPAGLGDGPDRSVLRAIGAVLGDLADLGYDAVWQVVSAAQVGAPHLRKRVFILAWPAADPPSDTGRLVNGNGLVIPGVDGLTLLPTPVAHDDGKSPEAHLAMKARMPGGERTQITSLAVLARAGFQQLLPTPAARDAGRGAGYGDQPGRPLSETILRVSPPFDPSVALLPTPRATDGSKGGPNQRGSSGDLMLPSAVMQLLPTPTVADARGTRNATAGRSEGTEFNSGITLSDVAHADRWGDYAPAIARWEQITGRPAPDPTEPGSKGQPRLSARFVEWMQGLPDGYVTAVPGISRNDALRLLGNSNPPQQYAAAIGQLAAVVEAITGDPIEVGG